MVSLVSIPGSSALRRWKEPFLQLLFPPVCLACGHIIRGETEIPQICGACLQGFEPASPEFVEREILRRLDPLFLDDLIVGLYFNPTLRAIIHHIKYQQMNRLAERFAGLIGREFLRERIPAPVDVILPVPLHRVRRKERGYNQSYFVARGIFPDEKDRIAGGLLKRTRHTRSQTRLNRQERRENVGGAFRVSDPEKVAGKTVVLVDDVVTTGATLNECARTLKEAGARRVIGLALATPPSPGEQPDDLPGSR